MTTTHKALSSQITSPAVAPREDHNDVSQSTIPLELQHSVAATFHSSVRLTESAAVDMPRIIETAVQSTRLVAANYEVKVESMVDPLAGPITGDAVRIEQAVLNLLMDAIQLAARGGKVLLAFERVGAHVELSIGDTGRSVTAQFLANDLGSFEPEPFFLAQWAAPLAWQLS